jgi:hypothetical protein
VTQESIELPLEEPPRQPSLRQPSLPRYSPPANRDLLRTEPDGLSREEALGGSVELTGDAAEELSGDLPAGAATLIGGERSPFLDEPSSGLFEGIDAPGDTAPVPAPPADPEADTAMMDAPLPTPEPDTSPTSAPAPREEVSTGKREAPAHPAEGSTQEVENPSMELPEETETLVDPGSNAGSVWATQPNPRLVPPPVSFDPGASYERSLIPLQDDIEEPSRAGRAGFTQSEFRLFKALGVAVGLFMLGVGIFTLYLVVRALF